MRLVDNNISKTENKNNNDKLKLQLEKQIAITQWIQTVGVIAEAILLTKLYSLNGDSEGEKKILTGIWIQTIGQLLEATAVSNQINNKNEYSILSSQKIAVTGDIVQSIGSALQALGGEELLLQDGIGNLFESIIP